MEVVEDTEITESAVEVAGFFFPRATIVSIKDGKREEPEIPSDIMRMVRNKPTRREFIRKAKGLGYPQDLADYFANRYNLKDEEPEQELEQEPNRPSFTLPKYRDRMEGITLEYLMGGVSKEMFYSRALKAGYRHDEASSFIRKYVDDRPLIIEQILKMRYEEPDF